MTALFHWSELRSLVQTGLEQRFKLSKGPEPLVRRRFSVNFGMSTF